MISKVFPEGILRLKDGRTFQIRTGKHNSWEELYAELEIEENQDHIRVRLAIHPKEDLIIDDIHLDFHQDYRDENHIYCNGYQSWSESKEINVRDYRWSPLRKIGCYPFGYSGDDHFLGEILREVPKNYIHHSWSYTYIRENNRSEDVLFFGSWIEHTGFTCFIHDDARNALRIRKDCKDLKLNHSYPVFDLFISKGPLDKIMEIYSQKWNQTKKQPLIGWTSWYKHYRNISEKICEQNLKPVAEQGGKVFQIDDGWQKGIGDWLETSPNFPSGEMKSISRKIKQVGMLPGIWLAPFIVRPGTDLWNNHPDWILKNKKGKPVKAGWNPLWGGTFYALDFGNPKCREYLASVFYKIFEVWNFSIVKLDFLYAVCLNPPSNGTRGQVMHEAMQWIRSICGEKIILACGVPLASCFGLVDFCRIGPDAHLQWDHWFLQAIRHRERVSTLLALRTMIARSHLNGHVFQNDSDVSFFGSEYHHLNPDEKNLLQKLTKLTGDVYFCSDNPAELKELEKESLLDHWNNEKSEIILNIYQESPDQFVIDCSSKKILVNLTDHPWSFGKENISKHSLKEILNEN
jgi:alpha-galactosidase